MFQWNTQQKKAIETTEGHVLLLAGPGTGKTRTLVGRAVHLIADCGVDAGAITLTTFTRKATQELLSRIADALREQGMESQAARIHIGNFHGLASELLQAYPSKAGFLPGWVTMDTAEEEFLLQQEINRFRAISGISSFRLELMGHPKWAAKNLANFLDRLREGFVDLREKEGAEGERLKVAKEVLHVYETILRKRNRMDYSEILYRTYRLLRMHPDVLEAAQTHCQYLMVDEYQDTNPVQEALLRLLQSKTGNLCVVGDDDQSLYRFRGATVQNLLHFSQQYPDTTIIALDTNYRSDGKILEYAEKKLREETQHWQCVRKKRTGTLSPLRVEKTLQPADSNNFREAAVHFLYCEEKKEWAAQLCQSLLHLHEAGVDYSEMVILSHSLRSEKMLVLQDALREANIPFYLTRGGSMMANSYVHDLIGFLFEAFQEPLDELMTQGILGREDLSDAIRHWNRLSRKAKQEGEQLIQKWKENLDSLPKGGTVSFSSLCTLFFAAAPLRMLVDRALQGELNARRQLETLRNFIADVESLLAMADPKWRGIHTDDDSSFLILFFGKILPFLKDSGSAAIREEQETRPVGKLPLFTIHQSKGLEFSVVFLVESEVKTYHSPMRGIDFLPRSPALGVAQTTDVEVGMDQARLLYTARTRAKHLLVETGVGKHIAGASFLPKEWSEIPFSATPTATLRQSYAYTPAIASYRACPRHTFFSRIIQLPESHTKAADYGTLVHVCLSFVHRLAQQRGAYPKASETSKLVEAVAEGQIAAGSYLSESELLRAKEELLRYVLHPPFPAERILASEYSIRATSDTAILEGTLDLLLQGVGETMDIVDFKTNRPTQIQQASYHDQLRFYRLLLQRAGWGKEGENILYYTGEKESEDLIDRTVDPQPVAPAFEAGVEATIQAMEREEYSLPTQDISHCVLCPYRFYCGRDSQAV